MTAQPCTQGSLAFGVACPALAPSLCIDASVLLVVGVAANAVGLLGVACAAAVAAAIVFSASHWFEMSRVHALGHAAKMVEHHASRDRPVGFFPRPPVRQISDASELDHAVAVAIVAPCPDPAGIGSCLVDAVPKARAVVFRFKQCQASVFLPSLVVHVAEALSVMSPVAVVNAAGTHGANRRPCRLTQAGVGRDG